MAKLAGKFLVWSGCALAVAVVSAAGSPAFAADSPEKVELVPPATVYLVLQDANIRVAPDTKASRVGNVKKGTRIESAGKAKGTDWVSVKQDGHVIGFVYASVLAAAIDGRLKRDLVGEEAGSTGPRCRHRVHFEGKSRVEDEPVETSDYRVTFVCRSDARDFEFDATMFITEIPYRTSKKDVYQINVDIPEIADTVEQVLSVTVMYDTNAGEVVFDTISDPEMSSAVPTKKQNAQTVTEALSGALAIAVSAWGPNVWKRLGEREDSPGFPAGGDAQ